MEQLRQLIAQQAEATKRFESQSQQYLTQQREEWTHKQRAQFHQFDGVIRDKEKFIQSLKQELANNQKRHLQELDQALQDAERRAQQSTPVFAGTSTQPYATPVEEKTLNAVAAVARAEAVPAFHSPGLSLGASAGNLKLQSTINTKIFAIQKKFLRGINFAKITKNIFQSTPPPRNKKTPHQSGDVS